MEHFIPPHCPNPDCEHHNPYGGKAYSDYIRWGSYITDTFGIVPRFRCRLCGKGFSRQTFAVDYYAKKQLAYNGISERLCSSTSLRAIGRALLASCDSISNRIARLSRQCIAADQRLFRERTSDEDIVADGIESFCVSQYFPNHITLAVGSKSRFVYAADHATIRRKGRMNRKQLSQRSILETRFRADPKAIERSFTRILDDTLRVFASQARFTLTLRTDKHHAYERSIATHSFYQYFLTTGLFEHITVSSRVPKTVSNPLFAVNYMEREIRKDLKEHGRETMCFGRNVNNQMDRMTVYIFMHNFVKAFRIGGKDPRTHGEMAGYRRNDIESELASLYTRRSFSTHFELSDIQWDTWKRRRQTPLKLGAEYLQKRVAL